MIRFNPLLSVVALAACCLLAGGCASEPRPEPKQLADPGYVSKRHFPTSASQDTWQFKDVVLDVSFIAPAAPGVFPIVVYLPGLGESVDSASLWRNAWAQAGYAVLTIQPHELGQSIWGSARARSGDFTALAAEQFAGPARAVTAIHLEYAFAELRRRAAAGQVPYSHLDLEHAAIAGFDLGALTAANIATSSAENARPAMTGWTLRAAIILSPPADVANHASRPAVEAVPLLCITGTADTDPFGLTASPRARAAACTALPAREKYALVLSNANHALLSGANSYSDDPTYTNDTPDPSAGANPWKKRWMPQSSPGDMHLGFVQLQESDDGRPPLSEEPDNAARRRRRLPPDSGEPVLFDPKLLAAVRAFSTAFLDAYLRKDSGARLWLERDASVWIGTAGVLQSTGTVLEK